MSTSIRIGRLESDIKVFKERKAKLQDSRRKLHMYYKYERITGSDGIQKEILNEYLKNIQDRANVIIEGISDFTIIMETSDIETENEEVDGHNKKVKKTPKRQTKKYVNKIGLEKYSLSRKKMVNIYKVDKEGNKVDVMSTSGFETFLMNVALRIGIAENMVYNRANWFIIDESDIMTADETNLLKTKNIIECLKEMVKFILVISHHPTIRGFFIFHQKYIQQHFMLLFYIN
jgi:DNA repair exonuclease SbcCD ATPase subunit